MSNLKDKSFLIVGLGLIGGSYAEGLKKAGYKVGAITRSQSSIDYALEHGIIDAGTVSVTPEFVSEYDIVVFSLYPHVFIEWIEKHQNLLKPGALLTDVTGVKGTVVDKVQSMLRPDLEFIGAHPMAGRETSGVQNATARVFEGANYIVTPTSKNTPEAIETCEEIGRILGFKTISRLTTEQHDEMIGFLSQLTHCIAVSLMNCKDNSQELARFTGDSFRDLTRIARINEVMWTELFLLNRDELLRQMDLFSEQFSRLRNAIASGDEATMKKMMLTSTERRGYFDKKA